MGCCQKKKPEQLLERKTDSNKDEILDVNETKVDDDPNNNNLETESFVYFIEKRLETIIKKNNIILIKLRIKWKI